MGFAVEAAKVPRAVGETVLIGAVVPKMGPIVPLLIIGPVVEAGCVCRAVGVIVALGSVVPITGGPVLFITGTVVLDTTEGAAVAFPTVVPFPSSGIGAGGIMSGGSDTFVVVFSAGTPVDGIPVVGGRLLSVSLPVGGNKLVLLGASVPSTLLAGTIVEFKVLVSGGELEGKRRDGIAVEAFIDGSTVSTPEEFVGIFVVGLVAAGPDVVSGMLGRPEGVMFKSLASVGSTVAGTGVGASTDEKTGLDVLIGIRPISAARCALSSLR